MQPSGSSFPRDTAGHGHGKAGEIPLSADLSATLSAISRQMGHSADLNIRPLQLTGGKQAALVFVEGLIDKQSLQDTMLRSLIDDSLKNGHSAADQSSDLNQAAHSFTGAGNIRPVSTMQSLLGEMMAGCAILLVDGDASGIAVDIEGGAARSVDEPQTQAVIRGPRDGMTESLGANISLVRKRVRTPQLWIKEHTIGQYTHTKVAVMYINGIADEAVVREVNERLGAIQTDGILESGYIEEYIQDRTWTPFPTIMNTERPDAVAGALLEGQVAIVTDGTPFTLLVPVTFEKFFQSSEDYYQRFDLASFLRLLRFVSFWVSMLLPSLYVAITTFHQEMLPSTLLISLAAQREGIPFPAFVEALLMEITFEVLREAGVRMPKLIGPAISIVGALVLGQAAVQAGLVSAAMVIVVSFTAISNFVTPAINMATASRLIRFFFMMLAASLGLFGITAGFVFLLLHMVGLRSFGVPYLSSVAPFIGSDWKDLFIRAPHWWMRLRPKSIPNLNHVREATRKKEGKDGDTSS
ncbi:spore germination protein KA [Paenibacillus sp. UNCCL117]|uniref:spore germination protein n=1 Tax=unclassified Paenibacillus TaxID=185978 RepID=UPI000884B72F|nr:MULTISPECIES: spore germination protein [unclassified Paenibacillus]SDC14834.1 spore germination protein KA [Paenibacillus sp. cl123]SFW17395.1 spore germination protein KA [Paenibacillus sp. UNCCL117]